MEACLLEGKFRIKKKFSYHFHMFLNGMRFFSAHRAVIKDDDKSLIIKNVIPADEGIYICDAHNGVGQITAKAQLVVNCKWNKRIFCKLKFNLKTWLF